MAESVSVTERREEGSEVFDWTISLLAEDEWRFAAVTGEDTFSTLMTTECGLVAGGVSGSFGEAFLETESDLMRL